MEKGTEFEEFEEIEMNYYWVSYLIIVLEYSIRFIIIVNCVKYSVLYIYIYML